MTILACSAGVVLRLVIAMKPHALIPAAWHEISLSVTPAEHAIEPADHGLETKAVLTRLAEVCTAVGVRDFSTDLLC